MMQMNDECANEWEVIKEVNQKAKAATAEWKVCKQTAD